MCSDESHEGRGLSDHQVLPHYLISRCHCDLCPPPQETTVGMNPVQIETGEFDEAIQIEEDFPAESKYT